MSENLPTFSESWHRICGQKIGLRPGVRIKRQFFRGERWHVVEDPFSNRFFRLHPSAYNFVGRLQPHRTVQEAWDECLQQDPENAPGQEEVLRLISQLYYANLLQYESAADSNKLFERHRKRREQEIRSRLLNVMFARIPLFDPDELMNRLGSLPKWIFSPIGALLWLLVVGLGVKVVLDNFTDLRQSAQNVLDPNNLILLYTGLIITKTIHEFGHAFACKRFGGEVHVMGIMLLIFTPTPYMDATSSWGFRNPWHRVLVGAAGMIVEIFIASIAAMIWANTGPGNLHALAYNMIFVASVSTLLFNGNPLLRYDGYYILSDLLGIPNLYQRSIQQLKFYMDRYLFGVVKRTNPTQNPREAIWLATYGVVSWIYRIIVFTGILFFVADQFLIVGILMFVVCAISWVIVPMGRFLHYLFSSPELERHRPRALFTSGAVFLVPLIVLGFVPFPYHFRAAGLVEAREKTEIINAAPGTVMTLLNRPGSWVTNGQPLMQLTNRQIDLQIAASQARREELLAAWRRALLTNQADLLPIFQRLESVNQQIQKLETDREALVVKAPQDGLWVAPDAEDNISRHLLRGTTNGLLINPKSFQFTASVLQTDANWLFAQGIRGGSIRLKGQAHTAIAAGRIRIKPEALRTLRSPALGWHGGGEIPVDVSDTEGRRATEPFFEITTEIESSKEASYWHGRSGKIRFNLHPQPLLKQWLSRFRQMLQKRYHL